MIKIKEPAAYRAKRFVASVLDWTFSPILSRLTHDEYFSSRTRMDCARAFLRRKLLQR